MLNPNQDRLDYGQVLTPPVGFRLDFAVGTTYSLDLDALVGACIALGLSEETDSALRSILAEKSKGISVRRAIFNLSKGDDKLMLRLQNKYRNILKKDPMRIANLAVEMGLSEDVEKWRKKAEKREENPETNLPQRDYLKRRLENEINALYDRLTQALKEENNRLRIENSLLKSQLEERNRS